MTKGRHHFTVDVEEVFHSTLLADRVPEHQWDDHARRSPRIVDWLLDEMSAREARGTFFIVGWLAEREPAMVRRIAEAGHEVASHSWAHRRVFDLTPDEFRSSLRRTQDVLEQLTGKAILGFRAPSFSILPGFEWAFDVLAEEGYRYDSSLVPTAFHPDYGFPEAESDPYWISRASGGVTEVPLLTLKVLGRRLPAGGGAYLRFFPFELVRRALGQAEQRVQPGTVYVHPWDLDPDLPRMKLPRATATRLYWGAAAARRRVVRLLDTYRFEPILETVRASAPGMASP